jgi:chemotaxis protein methyltransferase CheR
LQPVTINEYFGTNREGLERIIHDMVTPVLPNYWAQHQGTDASPFYLVSGFGAVYAEVELRRARRDPLTLSQPLLFPSLKERGDLIYQASGLHFDLKSQSTLERRLRTRVQALHLGSFEQYYLYLQFDRDRREELQRTLDAVAVHETYFFREMRALDAFSREMLPEAAERNRETRTLRVWSAGCSTGEEAYTLSILILESGLFDDWKIELSASDLSERVITLAREGRFHSGSFRTMDEERRARYFTPQPDGSWLIDERLRVMVNFGCFNLADSRRFNIYSDLDIIFCRNVMLYFDTAARRRTVTGFHQQMREGGYLVLGASESLVTLNVPFRLAHLQNDLVYQK